MTKNTDMTYWAGIFLTGAFMTQRISMVVGNILLSLSIICFFYYLVTKRKLLVVEQEMVAYYKMFVIFLVSMLPTIFFSGNIALEFKDYLGMWVYRAMPFFIITMIEIDVSRVKRMVLWVGGILCLDCICSFAQFLIWQDLFLRQNIIINGPLQFFEKHLNSGRGWGFGGSVLQLPEILCMVLPVLLVILLDDCFSKRVKKQSSVAFIIGLIAVIASLSRGAFFYLLILLPCIALPYVWRFPRKIVCLVLTIVFFVGIMMTQPAMEKRLQVTVEAVTTSSNVKNDYTYNRIYVWKASVRMIKDHPLLGIGIGQFKRVYDNAYHDPREFEDLIHAHNSLLQIFVETGILGFLGCISFFLYVLFQNSKNWYLKKNPYALMIVGCTLGLLLSSMTDQAFDSASVIKFFWFFLGILLVLKVKYNKQAEINGK